MLDFSQGVVGGGNTTFFFLFPFFPQVQNSDTMSRIDQKGKSQEEERSVRRLRNKSDEG